MVHGFIKNEPHSSTIVQDGTIDPPGRNRWQQLFWFIKPMNNSMVDRTIELLLIRFINQLIAGGHHTEGTSWDRSLEVPIGSHWLTHSDSNAKLCSPIILETMLPSIYHHWFLFSRECHCFTISLPESFKKDPSLNSEIPEDKGSNI